LGIGSLALSKGVSRYLRGMITRMKQVMTALAPTGQTVPQRPASGLCRDTRIGYKEDTVVRSPTVALFKKPVLNFGGPGIARLLLVGFIVVIGRFRVELPTMDVAIAQLFYAAQRFVVFIG
jgi:hypothetical protein